MHITEEVRPSGCQVSCPLTSNVPWSLTRRARGAGSFRRHFCAGLAEVIQSRVFPAVPRGVSNLCENVNPTVENLN